MEGYVLRGNRTREKIIEAAKCVFLEKGYKDATVTGMAEHAGVGYGTVYSHFSTGKDGVLLHIVEAIMGDFYQVASANYTPNTREEALQFTLKNTTDFLELAIIHQKWLALFYEAIGFSPIIRTQWEEITEKFIDRISLNVEIVKQKGLIRNGDYDPRVIAGSLYYPGEKYLWKLAFGQTSKDYKAIARDIAEVYTYGLFK